MSDSRKITCPECDTPNEPMAPFCENCGYRLRRPNTVREGHPAIRPAVAAAAAAAAPKLEETQPEQPPVRPASRHRKSTTPEQFTSLPEQTSPESLDSINAAINQAEEGNTVLEGLEPVDPSYTSSSDDQELRLPNRKLTATESGIFNPPEEKEANYAILGTVWVVSTVALMLLTYYLTTQANLPNRPIEIHEGNAKVAVPAGPFVMGLDETVRAFILMTCHKVADDTDNCEQDKLLKGEFPQTTVEVADFAIDTHELTNHDYEKCVSSGQCEPLDFKDCNVYTFQGLQPGMRVPKVIQEGHMPAACMTRSDAEAACKFRGGRLPSGAEWEKAARGEKGQLFPWGDTWLSNVANWNEIDILKSPIAGKLDGFEWASPPASFQDGMSPYGLFDTGGNVAEWVVGEDALQGEVRGGSWASTPFDLRTTGRLELSVTKRRADIGARCAYDIGEATR